MRDMMLKTTPQCPHEEDHALFLPPLGQCEIALIPRFRLNERNERVIHGLLPGDAEVEVLFAGRRIPLADPLISRLQHLWSRAQSETGLKAPTRPESVRLRTAIYGSWRSRFDYDADGWQTKRYQLVAAIWRIHDATGRPITRGSAPMLTKSGKRPVQG